MIFEELTTFELSSTVAFSQLKTGERCSSIPELEQRRTRAGRLKLALAVGRLPVEENEAQ